MPAASTEYQLGQLTSSVDGLTRELAATRGTLATDMASLRAEGRQREETILERIDTVIAAHDQRDDERFESQGTRLRVIENKLGVYDTEAMLAEKLATRGQDWRTARLAALAAVIGGAIAGLPALIGFFKGIHP